MDSRIPHQETVSLFQREKVSGPRKNYRFQSQESFREKSYPELAVGLVNENYRAKSWQQLLALLILAVSGTAAIYLVRHHLREPLPTLSELEQTSQIGKTEFTGKIQPAKTFAIATKSPAIVEQIKVQIGDRVKAGQPLLVLKNLEAEKELQKAKKEQQALWQQRKIARKQQQLALMQQQQMAQQQQRLALLQQQQTIRQQQQASRQQQKIAQQQQEMTLKQKDMGLQEQQMAKNQEIVKLERKIEYFDENIAPLRTNVAEAESELKSAQNQMQQVPLPQRQDSIERAEALYQRAKSRYQRYEELRQEGAVSQEQLEQIEAEMKVAEADLDSAKAVVVATKDFETAQAKQSQLQRQLIVDQQQQELAEMKAKLELARLQHQQLTEQRQMIHQQLAELRQIQIPNFQPVEMEVPEVELADIQLPEVEEPEILLSENQTTEVVKATRSGVIVDLPVAIGNQIFAGTKVVDMAEMKHLNVEIPVSTRLVNALYPGQRATVEIGGRRKSQEFKATVVRINPLPSEDLNHKVILQFKNENDDLLAGQLATVHFSQE